MTMRRIGTFAVLCQTLRSAGRSGSSSATAFYLASVQQWSLPTTGKFRSRFLTSHAPTQSPWRCEAKLHGKSTRGVGGTTVAVGMSASAQGRGRRDRKGQRGRKRPDYGPDRAGQHRYNVPPGTSVEVVQKHHQRSGQLTAGVVSRLLTSSGFHPRGIKVMLTGGIVGRVQNVLTSQHSTLAASCATPAIGTGGSVGGRLNRTSSSDCEGVLQAVEVSSDDEVTVVAVVNPTMNSSTAGDEAKRRRVQMGEQLGDTELDSGSRQGRSGDRLRNSLASRTQGRSWSMEGGELVSRGEFGEELARGDAAAAAVNVELRGHGRSNRRRNARRRRH